MNNELLVGGVAICKRFKISRARLRHWEHLGAPVYRRGMAGNAPLCADYYCLLQWEQRMAVAWGGRMNLMQNADQDTFPVW